MRRRAPNNDHRHLPLPDPQHDSSSQPETGGPRPDPVDGLRRLQETAGNQAVVRMLRSVTGGPDPVDADLGERIHDQVGGGQPVPAGLRAELTAGLGQQLGDVRLHTDDAAGALAAKVGARAFTTGQDVFFGTGAYDPASPEGFRVLAHEAAHTLQPERAAAARPLSADLLVSTPGDADERAASVAAEQALDARGTAPDATATAPTAQSGDSRSGPVLVRRYDGPAAPVATESPGAQQIRAAIGRAVSSDQIMSLIDALQQAGPRPDNQSVAVTVVVDGQPVQLGSDEIAPLLAAARQAAGITAGDPASAPGSDLTVPVPLAPADLAVIRARLGQIEVALADGSSGITDADRAAMRTAIAQARASLADYEELAQQGHARQAASAPLLLAGGVLAGDDVTGVGAADDIALPFVGLALLVVYLATRPAPSPADLNNAWQGLTSALETLSTLGTTIVLAVQGPRLAGNTRQLAIHLARLLAVAAVGGQPSGEPPKNNNDDDPHWWNEIKAFLKGIQQAIKGASRRQVIRELIKQGFTEEQIAEIEAKLIEAARMMGEDPPDFLPPP